MVNYHHYLYLLCKVFCIICFYYHISLAIIFNLMSCMPKPFIFTTYKRFSSLHLVSLPICLFHICTAVSLALSCFSVSYCFPCIACCDIFLQGKPANVLEVIYFFTWIISYHMLGIVKVDVVLHNICTSYYTAFDFLQLAPVYCYHSFVSPLCFFFLNASRFSFF